MSKIGFHTDAFNSRNWNLEQCVEWAEKHKLRRIECGVIDGTAYIQALGYFPHVSLLEDPITWRKRLERAGLCFSQLDAAYPMSLMTGLTVGVQTIVRTIQWAKLAGCRYIDTTDNRTRPEGMSDKDGLRIMKMAYGEILKVAETHDIIINVEPHGYYTTNPVFMDEILNFYESPNLMMNMDTGNTFIAGQDPVAFVERFKNRIKHVHVKDVTAELAEAARGGMTGIAMSHSAIGSGVNADNIRSCVKILLENGYDGDFSLECDGSVIEDSIVWFRNLLGELMG